jgi:hypothetical protein
VQWLQTTLLREPAPSQHDVTCSFSPPPHSCLHCGVY